jgi:hypothetical protein
MVFHSTYVMLCVYHVVYNVCMYKCMYVCFFWCRLHWNVCTVPPPAPGLAGARLSAASDHLGGAEDSACGIYAAHIHTYIHTVHAVYVMVVDLCICKCYECIRLTRSCNGSCMYCMCYMCVSSILLGCVGRVCVVEDGRLHLSIRAAGYQEARSTQCGMYVCMYVCM